jgi:hypothetical protein
MIAFISIAPFGALAGLLAGIYLVLIAAAIGASPARSSSHPESPTGFSH